MEQAAMEVWYIHYRQESQLVSPGKFCWGTYKSKMFQQ